MRLLRLLRALGVSALILALPARAMDITTQDELALCVKTASNVCDLQADLQLDSSWGSVNLAATLNGNNHVITLDSTLQRGLFGNINTGSEVQDLTVRGDLTITSTTASFGLLGGIASGGTIKNVGTHGSIRCSGSTGCKNLGGLVGSVTGNLVVSNSFSTAVLSVEGSQTYSVGGLFGNVTSSSMHSLTISGSFYRSSSLHLKTTDTGYLGGLIGYTKNFAYDMTQCYAVVDRIDFSPLSDVYSGVGGIIGTAQPSTQSFNVYGCYADIGAWSISPKLRTNAGGAFGSLGNSANSRKVQVSHTFARVRKLEYTTADGSTDKTTFGGFAGFLNTNGADINTIEHSWAQIDSAVLSGVHYAAGFIGSSYASPSIENCYCDVTFALKSEEDAYPPALFSGSNNAGASFVSCVAATSVISGKAISRFANVKADPGTDSGVVLGCYYHAGLDGVGEISESDVAGVSGEDVYNIASYPDLDTSDWAARPDAIPALRALPTLARGTNEGYVAPAAASEPWDFATMWAIPDAVRAHPYLRATLECPAKQNGDDVCTYCPTGDCESCSGSSAPSNGVCAACASGQAVDPRNSRCFVATACSASQNLCEVCESSTVCVTCKPGNLLDLTREDGTVPCIAREDCTDGHLEMDGECVVRPCTLADGDYGPSCQACTATECLRCGDGYVLDQRFEGEPGFRARCMPSGECAEGDGYHVDGGACRLRDCSALTYGNDCARCTAAACIRCSTEGNTVKDGRCVGCGPALKPVCAECSDPLVCERCNNGYSLTQQKDRCVACRSDQAGDGLTCTTCTKTQKISADRSRCEDCPTGQLATSDHLDCSLDNCLARNVPYCTECAEHDIRHCAACSGGRLAITFGPNAGTCVEQSTCTSSNGVVNDGLCDPDCSKFLVISSQGDLEAFRTCGKARGSFSLGGSFALTDSIAPLTDLGCELDGKGFRISNINFAVAYDVTDEDASFDLGLFGDSAGFTLKNIELEAAISVTDVPVDSLGVAFAVLENSTASNVTVVGSVYLKSSLTGAGASHVGCVAGQAKTDLSDLYASCTLDCKVTEGSCTMGGLVGSINATTSLITLSGLGAASDVICQSMSCTVGGLVGRLSPKTSTTITRCFANSQRIAASSPGMVQIGGFLGTSLRTPNINNCYADTRKLIVQTDMSANVGGFGGAIGSNSNSDAQAALNTSYARIRLLTVSAKSESGSTSQQMMTRVGGFFGFLGANTKQNFTSNFAVINKATLDVAPGFSFGGLGGDYYTNAGRLANCWATFKDVNISLRFPDSDVRVGGILGFLKGSPTLDSVAAYGEFSGLWPGDDEDYSSAEVGIYLGETNKNPQKWSHIFASVSFQDGFSAPVGNLQCTSCYVDASRKGLDTTAQSGVTFVAKADLKKPESYPHLGLDDLWEMYQGNGLPVLAGLPQLEPGKVYGFGVGQNPTWDMDQEWDIVSTYDSGVQLRENRQCRGIAAPDGEYCSACSTIVGPCVRCSGGSAPTEDGMSCVTCPGEKELVNDNSLCFTPVDCGSEMSADCSKCSADNVCAYCKGGRVLDKRTENPAVLDCIGTWECTNTSVVDGRECVPRDCSTLPELYGPGCKVCTPSECLACDPAVSLADTCMNRGCVLPSSCLAEDGCAVEGDSCVAVSCEPEEKYGNLCARCNEDVCLECQPGISADENGLCKGCGPDQLEAGCLECSSSTRCESCKPGVGLAGGVCAVCPQGQVSDGRSPCTPCAENERVSPDHSSCIACPEGEIPSGGDREECVPALCTMEPYKVDGCEYCDSEVPTRCSRCAGADKLVSFVGSTVGTCITADECTRDGGVSRDKKCLRDCSTDVINNQDDLDMLRACPTKDFTLGSSFSLTRPIPPISGYSGTLDGRGYTISNINFLAAGLQSVGLFLDSAFTLRNVHLAGAASISSSLTSAGLVAGELLKGRVSGVNVSGSLTVTSAADNTLVYVGCLAGLTTGQSGLAGSCNVKCTARSSQCMVGGLLGATAQEDVEVSTCAFSGSVTCDSSICTAGGLVGRALAGAAFSDSFSVTTSVSATSSSYSNVGGFLGASAISKEATAPKVSFVRCYSRTDSLSSNSHGVSVVGGFFGHNEMAEISADLSYSAVGSLSVEVVAPKTASYVGGFIGASNYQGAGSMRLMTTSCFSVVSSGAVTVNGKVGFGGFVGLAYSTAEATGFRNCWADFGSLSIKRGEACASKGEAPCGIGGFLGASKGGFTYVSCATRGEFTALPSDETTRPAYGLFAAMGNGGKPRKGYGIFMSVATPNGIPVAVGALSCPGEERTIPDAGCYVDGSRPNSAVSDAGVEVVSEADLGKPASFPLLNESYWGFEAAGPFLGALPRLAGASYVAAPFQALDESWTPASWILPESDLNQPQLAALPQCLSVTAPLDGLCVACAGVFDACTRCSGELAPSASGDACEACPAGTELLPDNSGCEVIDTCDPVTQAHCKDCADASTCTTCDAGYLLDARQGAPTTCMAASECRDDQGYYSPDSERCEARPCGDQKYGNDCATCSAAACLGCATPGNAPQGGRCVVCLPEQANCLTCSDASTCTSCEGGHILDYRQAGARGCVRREDCTPANGGLVEPASGGEPERCVATDCGDAGRYGPGCQQCDRSVCLLCGSGYLDLRAGSAQKCVQSCSGELEKEGGSPQNRTCVSRACASVPSCAACEAQAEERCARCGGGLLPGSTGASCLPPDACTRGELAVSGCAACDAAHPDLCAGCREQFAASGNACLPCGDPLCAACPAAALGSCDRCLDGNLLDRRSGEGPCVAEGECRDDQGYYSPEGLSCQKRPCGDARYGNECASCSAAACLSCLSGNAPIAGVCDLTACTAQQDAAGCEVCAGGANCLACRAGFALDEAAHACRGCPADCASCRLSSLAVCDACREGAFLDAREGGQPGTCLTSCEGALLAAGPSAAGGQLCRSRACASIRGCASCREDDEALCASCSGSVPRDGGRACGGLSAGAVVGTVVGVLVVAAAVAAVCVYFLVVRRKALEQRQDRLLADAVVI